MKRAVVLLLVAFLLAIPASAHSGRTDSNGGHYNHSTGEYHYHHGYPAHQHINGKCPYDIDDKTSHSSSSSSGSSTRSASGVPKESLQAMYPKASGGKSDDNSWIFPVAVVGVVGVAVTVAKIRAKRRRDLERRKKEEEARVALARFREERTAFIERYQGKALADVTPSSLPDAYVGGDGLPCSPGDGRWGPVYTVYVTNEKSQVFHKKQICGANHGKPTNLAEVGKRRPCARCYSTCVPDLGWYYERKKLLDLCRRYDVNPFVDQQADEGKE